MPKLLSKPHPKGYEPPKFHNFDGRNGSAMEHVSRFIHTIGPYTGDRELCLKEFAKSLVNKAYTRYTTLRPGSIKTWDEMMERFCAKYYPGEYKVTFQSLQMVRQRPGEDPIQFIKRFEDVLWIVMETMKKRSSWRPAYLTCTLTIGLISKIYV